MTVSTKDLVIRHYDSLKKKHGFSCTLTEEELDENYMMLFDSEQNSIVFDAKRIEENFEQSVKYGFYRDYDISKLILFTLLHELGHYYDYQENKNAFYIESKAEYIQMELNGIQQAKKLVPADLARQFHEFNLLIINSYKRDLPE